MTTWTYRYTLQSHSPILLAFDAGDRLPADCQAKETGTKVAVIYNQPNAGRAEGNSLSNIHTSFTEFEGTVSQTG